MLLCLYLRYEENEVLLTNVALMYVCDSGKITRLPYCVKITAVKMFIALVLDIGRHVR